MAVLSDLTSPPKVLSRERLKISASWFENVASILVGCWIAGLLYYGWVNRWSRTINPEQGVGYALGIIGGSMMLLLLVYPLRKRIKPLANFGSVGFWFRFHMLLGLFGPLAVLFHARFTWGALNSAVALNAMLIVAGSGLVGRFLYSRVHRGYSGRKLEVRSLLSDMHEVAASLDRFGESGEQMKALLIPFEAAAVKAGSSFWNSATSVFSLGWNTRKMQWKMGREIKKAFRDTAIPLAQTRTVRKEILEGSAAYFLAVRRAGEFAFYDRMLRLWHVLHLPLFFLLIATAVLHIVAVHMY
jgi:hypothetical protein